METFQAMMVEAEGVLKVEVEKEEVKIDEDKLCMICFVREQDTMYAPCEHTSCRTCIQTHLQNK